MADKWIVLKFGGTSVAGRPQWDAIVSLVRKRRASGFNVLLVCSAVAGVTNRLTRLADAPDSKQSLAELLELHRALGRDLEVDEQHWLAEGESALKQRLAGLRQDAGPRSRAALLAMGEWLSTRIALQFLR